jgi:hypothetical protein
VPSRTATYVGATSLFVPLAKHTGGHHAERVGPNNVVGDGEGVLGQHRHQRGVRVGEAEPAGLAVEQARGVWRLRAQR